MKNGYYESGGDKYWFKNDKYHCENGPAVEYTDGTKAWYLNGKLHRESGPAVTFVNGTKGWYLNDKRYTQEDYIMKMRKRKLKNL